MKLILTTVAIVLVAGSHATADTTFNTTFDEFNTGWFFDNSESEGWSGNGNSGTAGNNPNVDAEIVDLNNNKVFRLSNATTSGNYGTTHAAPPEIELAGESATGAVNRRFQYSFDFMSASDSLQEGLYLTCPTGWETGSASRHALFYITDDATDGLSIGIWDVNSAGFQYTTLATGLDRTTWHSVEVDILFKDGAANDEMTVALNGSTVGGLTTWEQYYEDADTPQPEVAGIDTVIFRASGEPVENVRGGGIYFDNLNMSSQVPEPATMSLLGLCGLALIRRRRTA